MTLTDVVMDESKRILVREGVPHVRVSCEWNPFEVHGAARVACSECGRVELVDLPAEVGLGVRSAERVVAGLEQAIAAHLHKPVPEPKVRELPTSQACRREEIEKVVVELLARVRAGEVEALMLVEDVAGSTNLHLYASGSPDLLWMIGRLEALKAMQIRKLLD